MSPGQIIGVVLLCTAFADLVVGLVVVGPRIPNPASRRTVVTALVLGAGVLAGLGVAFLVGAL
jgi:hypothetical protein